MRDVKRLMEDAVPTIPALDLSRAVERAEQLQHRRLLGRVALSVLVMVTLGASIFIATGLERSGDFPPAKEPLPQPAQTDEVGILPDHLIRLQKELPDHAVRLATRDLVFLYRLGDEYVGFFEGIYRGTCPMHESADTREEACIFTAWRQTISVGGTQEVRASHLMDLIEPSGAEVLYRGEPATGTIGVDSVNACDRSEVFEPFFECLGGKMRFVTDEESGKAGPGLFEPPRFTESQGWHSSDSGATKNGDSPSGWASTLDLGEKFSFRKLERLGPDDIALYAILITPADYPNYPQSGFPERTHPLRFAQAERHPSFQGQWDPDIPLHLLSASLEGHRLELWIWFGRPEPSARQIERVDAQLEGLRLPEPWS